MALELVSPRHEAAASLAAAAVRPECEPAESPGSPRHRDARRRAPRQAQRALRGAPARWQEAQVEGPVTLRLPLPARILRMAEFGLRHPETQHEGWWRRVEEEMQAFVFRHVSPHAPGLRMQLDPETWQVEIRYRAS